MTKRKREGEVQGHVITALNIPTRQPKPKAHFHISPDGVVYLVESSGRRVRLDPQRAEEVRRKMATGELKTSFGPPEEGEGK